VQLGAEDRREIVFPGFHLIRHLDSWIMGKNTLCSSVILNADRPGLDLGERRRLLVVVAEKVG